jgi:hypothetical protein
MDRQRGIVIGQLRHGVPADEVDGGDTGQSLQQCPHGGRHEMVVGGGRGQGARRVIQRA